ncbi:MATE family efflux transporter [Bradyrhizobium sp. U87765 SZCCT0131]|uniref:MATE family efflux transporter n=1 Tax=unclassified Bradyrhizobium TaxID=2631580 RepID=UPI001BAAB241|nr:MULTISPECIES: MATE family efflux transporter [unclassified Bradyrhizobium]MBR1218746.1 MATE family efflux transporter [Bradyrhizobium sp. U87765 SZCCT0131]MBR1265495.1 MATE family efflux transporter [Bradyrhizobium sp. U87765 SZCCT0134]MBR1304245.1 MATE family efflux transporter [Bradyrhizobium sp. U87765 SZCCT0110]MBR1319850.1 MATE family efflux transporter [Bradyrhizobium sp. U87765 SZCCT0109]MBR1348176.1 MATE family efflux transporter [Bradyrhizobium sp. U87765 SZCCT0048]
MTDLGVAELQAIETPVLAAHRISDPLLDGPILPTLLRLAAPNVVALTVGVCVAIAETSYVGRLGIEPLAAMALVFPFVILTMTMSGGAMGGGVASAIARALGAGDTERATLLALHAILIGVCLGLIFTAGMLAFGPYLLQLLGGHGRVLTEAVGYIEIFFGGAVIPWLMNTLTSILRGTGNMRLPSALILLSATIQITLGGALGLGYGPIPQLGMRGVACGTLIAFATGLSISFWYLLSGRGRLDLRSAPLRFRAEMFFDILKVGAVACFSPLQSVLAITIFTHMLARFGTEVLAGYGIGARLEFMLTSIAFAVGVASVPMVGMAIGAGRIARARRVAWTGGTISFIAVAVAGMTIAAFPWLWVSLFTEDPGVRAASYHYLEIAAPLYAFIGLNISLYFSSQGAARILGPVLAQTARLAFITAGSLWLVSTDATVTAFFVLAACSMALLGLSCAASVKLTSWGNEPPADAESTRS